MFTIALVGPDGAGKSTISRRIMDSLPIPTKYIYMGINLDAINFALPTTLLWKRIRQARGKQINMGGPPDPNRNQPISNLKISKRIIREIKSAFRIANLIAEEWFRQFLTWYFQFRGYIVIFDRHFYFDYYRYHISNINTERTISDWIHGLMLNHVFPKPDLVICLDAPAEVLFARKGEGTVELLELRRQEYLQLRDSIKHFEIVDVTQSEDEVTRQVSNLILDFYNTKKAARVAMAKFRAK